MPSLHGQGQTDLRSGNTSKAKTNRNLCREPRQAGFGRRSRHSYRSRNTVLRVYIAGMSVCQGAIASSHDSEWAFSVPLILGIVGGHLSLLQFSQLNRQPILQEIAIFFRNK